MSRLAHILYVCERDALRAAMQNGSIYRQQFAQSGYIVGMLGDFHSDANNDGLFLTLSYQGFDNIVVEEGLFEALVGNEDATITRFKRPLPVVENQIIAVRFRNAGAGTITNQRMAFAFVPDPSVSYTHVSPTQLVCANWAAVDNDNLAHPVRTNFNRSGYIVGFQGAMQRASSSEDVRIQTMKQNREYFHSRPVIWDAVVGDAYSQVWLKRPIPIQRGETIQTDLYNNANLDLAYATLVYHFVPTDLDPLESLPLRS